MWAGSIVIEVGVSTVWSGVQLLHWSVVCVVRCATVILKYWWGVQLLHWSAVCVFRCAAVILKCCITNCSSQQQCVCACREDVDTALCHCRQRDDLPRCLLRQFSERRLAMLQSGSLSRVATKTHTMSRTISGDKTVYCSAQWATSSLQTEFIMWCS